MKHPLPEWTVDQLWRLHPALFSQLCCIFGKTDAARIVLAVHREGMKQCPSGF
jgi:hypothetical protein